MFILQGILKPSIKTEGFTGIGVNQKIAILIDQKYGVKNFPMMLQPIQDRLWIQVGNQDPLPPTLWVEEGDRDPERRFMGLHNFPILAI